MNGWRESQAAAHDEQAAVIADALERLDVVHELLEARGSHKLCSELRGLAAGLRSEANAIASEATALRTKPSRDGFPMSVTTRYPRRRAAAALEPPHEEEP